MLEKSVTVPKKKTEWYVSKPQSLLYQVQQQHFKDGLYFEPYIMHFIEIKYMSCIPWLLYVMYSMAKTFLYIY